jgi:hypothetical protein
MKNVKCVIGVGFKPTISLFGVSINYYSVYKFENKNCNIIKVALVNNKNNTVCKDEMVYTFNNEEAFEAWKDEIYRGTETSPYLHYQDARLICRAYPIFYDNTEDEDDN